MKASDIRNLVILSVVVLGGLSYGAYRYFHYRQFQKAYIEAQQAFGRAWEYKDAGQLIFEQRWTDLEVSRDRLKRVGVIGDGDRDRLEIISGCVGDLEGYRRDAREADQALRYKLDVEFYLNDQVRITNQVTPCFDLD